MIRLLLFCLLTTLYAGCKKDRDDKVEIYLLESFTRTVAVSTIPAITSITDAGLANTPLVSDSDVAGYSPLTRTFYLKKNVAPLLKDFGPDKAFAVTINKQPVYIGEFRPSYLSSIVFGIAWIDPFWVTATELPVSYVEMDNNPLLRNLDKRNNSRLLDVLQKSGRLR